MLINKSQTLLILALLSAGLMGPLVAPGWAATELVLHTRFFNDNRPEKPQRVSGTLPRELARQALLIAAREGIGMRTCDGTLREKPATEEPLELLLTVDCLMNWRCRLRLYKHGPLAAGEAPPSEEEAIWKRNIKQHAHGMYVYPTLGPKLEESSRGEMVELLRELGGEKAELLQPEGEAGLEPEGEAEVEVEELLMQVDIVSQFAAARELHRRLRTEETPETLQALVRAYANLGLLTETCWGQSTNAFKARSMLYSYRLQKLHSDDALTPWAAAYCQALAGIHFKAIEIIEAIDPDVFLEEMPLWATLVLPYCYFDGADLEDLAEGGLPISPWAAYLRAWMAFNTQEVRQIADTVRRSIQTCPDAMNLYFMLTHRQPIGIERMATGAEMMALLQAKPARLRLTPTLPAAIGQAAEDPDHSRPPGEYWRKIITAIDGVETRSEPSWGMLARMLEDQAVRAAYNNISATISSSAEFELEPLIEYWAPFVENHPDADYFRVKALLRTQDSARILEACKNLRFHDPNRWMISAFSDTKELTNQWGNDIGALARRDADRDFTCQSVSETLRYYRAGSDTYEMFVREITEFSPHSPIAVISSIAHARRGSEPITAELLTEWEERARTSPTAWRSIGDAYNNQGKIEDAVRCYEESYLLSPESDTLYNIAWMHERLEHFDKVVPTLERYLEVEDWGLGHHQINRQIAEFYLRRDDPLSAKPYAVAAAESYSAWGLNIAARVCEQLGLNDEADEWYAAQSQAYPSSSGVDWYLFRRRIGSDDLAEPRQLALRAVTPDTQDVDNHYHLLFYWLEGRNDVVQKNAYRWVEENSNIFSESIRLVAAAKAGDSEAEAEARQRILEISRAPSDHDTTWMKNYIALINQICGDDPVDPERLSADVDDLLSYDGMASLYKCERSSIVAQLLELHGHPEPAGRCYRYAVAANTPYRFLWHLAKAEAHRFPDESSATSEEAADGEAEETKPEDQAEQPAADEQPTDRSA